MTGTILIKFTDPEDKESGVRQMFAFAADDYEAKTGVKATTATGTILEADDTMENIDGFIQLCIKGDYDLIIFDINIVNIRLRIQIFFMLFLQTINPFQ